MKKLIFALLLLTACSSTPAVIPGDTPQQVTMTGTFLCLPHKLQGEFETQECAFGIQTDDGKYYAVDFGLSSTSGIEPNVGEKFSAQGILIPIEQLSDDRWQNYPVEGIFSVTSRL